MQIRAAHRKDREMLSRLDRHIRPEELEDVDTEESSVMEHRDYACYYACCLLW